MAKTMTLYHGSLARIEKPEFGKGKIKNDYGPGFYCTKSYNLACEWASKFQGEDGYVNKYALDTKGLKILDLSSPEYNILNWITLLLKNRTFDLKNSISVIAKEYLMENFLIDISKYDVIKGYRADDSYFSFAEDFLNNNISVEQLSRAMKLGKLGIQYVVISEKAFGQLYFVDADVVNNSKYYSLYQSRDVLARQKYRAERENVESNVHGLFVLDIVRGGIKDGDTRI